MKSLISEKLLAIGFVFVGTSVFGANYYLKSGATDFTVPSNYTTNSAGTLVPATLPGSRDQIVLPDDATFSITGGTEAFNVLSGVKRIRPRQNTVLEFVIPDGTTNTLNAAVNWDGDTKVWNASTSDKMIHHFGRMVKNGGGTLILSASGTMKYDGITQNQDYFTAIDLKQGTLKFPQYAVGNMHFGDVTMSEGSTLVTCCNIDNKEAPTHTYVRSFSGAGTVTNESGRASGQLFGTYARNDVVENAFHGRICHPVKLWIQGRITHYGTETGLQLPVTVENNRGHLNGGSARGVYSFENVALFGQSESIQLYGLGGGIHYFGLTDATIGKTMNLYSYTHPAFVDAGSHGGLTFSGNWQVSADSENSAVQKWLVLTGSNSVPCKISGDFMESKFSGKDYATESPRTIFTQKLGSGVWRFAGTRNHGGGFAIEEGTLQFDSIAEKGIASALGRSTNLTAACSVRDPGYEDYAFSLGSTAATAPAAAFEFTGSKSCQCGTRPLVLAGKGGALKASGSGDARIGFGGISARDSGGTTLILDGENKLSNVATGITDGNGVVNVVKEGEGEWFLSGTNTFSGDLRVKSGVLTVQGSKYSWFRFTVKETVNKSQYLAMRQLALYDANGIRQNICLNVNTNKKVLASLNGNVDKYFMDSDWMALAPGSFAFGSDSFLCTFSPEKEQYVDQLFSDIGNTASGGIERFDGVISKGKQCQLTLWKTDGNSISIKRDDSGSWIPFVMRLTNGTPAIVSYDIESFGNDSRMWPKVGSMEASVDGIHWELVELNESGDVIENHEYDLTVPLGESETKKSNRWYSDGTKQTNWDPATGTTPRPGAGFPIRGHADMPTPLQNVRSVSVDTGAILKADDAITISSLKIYGSGSGTIDGFTFAQNGTLDVVFDGEIPSSAAIPGTYVNCNGFANIANWTLKVNGVANNKYFASMKNDGTLVFARRGLVVTIR